MRMNCLQAEYCITASKAGNTQPARRWCYSRNNFYKLSSRKGLELTNDKSFIISAFILAGGVIKSFYNYVTAVLLEKVILKWLWNVLGFVLRIPRFYFDKIDRLLIS